MRSFLAWPANIIKKTLLLQEQRIADDIILDKNNSRGVVYELVPNDVKCKWYTFYHEINKYQRNTLKVFNFREVKRPQAAYKFMAFFVWLISTIFIHWLSEMTDIIVNVSIWFHSNRLLVAETPRVFIWTKKKPKKTALYFSICK